jgi:uroporphyrinogen-III synthase
MSDSSDAAPVPQEAAALLRGGDHPLADRTVLVTRAPDQSGELLSLLAEAGAETIAMPTIAFFPPVDPRPLEQAIARLQSYAWIAFTSSNAVHAFFERLHDDVPAKIGHVRLAAVGPKTAEAIGHWGLTAQLVAAKGNAASLADGLGRVCLPGDHLLYPRAERVSDDLVGHLQRFKVVVHDPIAYRTVPPTGDSFRVAQKLKDGAIHWITALSGSALRHLLAMLPEPEHVHTARIASIGPRTSSEAVALGLEVGAEAAEPTAAALVAAIVDAQVRCP